MRLGIRGGKAGVKGSGRYSSIKQIRKNGHKSEGKNKRWENWKRSEMGISHRIVLPQWSWYCYDCEYTNPDGYGVTVAKKRVVSSGRCINKVTQFVVLAALSYIGIN